jgi:pyocin large subunit-like protein
MREKDITYENIVKSTTQNPKEVFKNSIYSGLNKTQNEKYHPGIKHINN